MTTPTDEFAGRIAIVTGAASGIGLTVAEHFAARGARVVAVDRSDAVVATAADIPGTGHLGIARDLTDPAAASEIVTRVVAELGAPSILVNSAGIAIIEPALDVTPDHWTALMAVNLNASFYMAQAVGRVMVEQGFGRIVNLASQASVVGLDGHAAYCASKAAIVGLTRVLSLEWAPSGVTVNAVSPTIVETPMGITAWSGEKGDKARAQIPTGRFAKPEEVASLIAYLSSDIAGMITGENVIIDGGYTSV